jgi:hypothetical protein
MLDPAFLQVAARHVGIPDADDALRWRILGDYGAMFATIATPPPCVVFESAEDVAKFQGNLDTAMASFDGVEVRLQRPAFSTSSETRPGSAPPSTSRFSIPSQPQGRLNTSRCSPSTSQTTPTRAFAVCSLDTGGSRRWCPTFRTLPSSDMRRASFPASACGASPRPTTTRSTSSGFQRSHRVELRGPVPRTMLVKDGTRSPCRV